MKEPHILVIGSGSIAHRLVSLLHNGHARVSVYQHRKGLEPIKNTTQTDSLTDAVDGVVIATPTTEHIQYLEHFAGVCPLFIEKPVAAVFDARLKKVISKLSSLNYFVMAGFQMRFVPVVEHISQLLQENKLGKILSVSLYVGQYLPFWRPSIDYRTSYSAKYEQGGGAALDLIHEIDLAVHWFGPLKNLQIRSEKLGDMEVNTESFVRIETKGKPVVQITLDTLNHNKMRTYSIIGTSGSIIVDLYHNHYDFTDVNGKTTKITDPAFFDVPKAYQSEISYFLSHLSDKPPQHIERALGLDALKIAQRARKNYEY